MSTVNNNNANNNNSSPILSLIQPLLLQTFSYLPGHQLAQQERVCKAFLNVIRTYSKQLWEAALQYEFNFPNPVSQDPKLQYVLLVNLKDGYITKQPIAFHSHAAPIGQLLAEGGHLYSLSEDGTIKIWKINENCKNERTLTSDLKIHSMLKKGNQLFSISEPFFKIWDLSTYKSMTLKDANLWSDETNPPGLNCVIENRDKLFINYGTGIKVFDLAKQRFTSILNGHSLEISALIKDGDFFYSASADGSIIKWSFETLEQVAVFKHSDHSSMPYELLSLLKFGESLYVGCSDGGLRIFNESNNSWKMAFIGKPVTKLAASDGVLYVVGSDSFNSDLFAFSLPSCGFLSKLHLTKKGVITAIYSKDKKLWMAESTQIYRWDFFPLAKKRKQQISLNGIARRFQDAKDVASMIETLTIDELKQLETVGIDVKKLNFVDPKELAYWIKQRAQALEISELESQLQSQRKKIKTN